MRKPPLLPMISLVVAAVCVKLGFWQLSRLEERRALNRSIERELEMPAIDLSAAELRDPEYRRVRAAGRFDFAHQIVVIARSLHGVPGVYVVTPFLIDSTSAVLVERGWVPSPDARSVELDSLNEDATREVAGVAIPLALAKPPSPATVTPEWPLSVKSLDSSILGALLPYRVAGYVVRRTTVPEQRADWMRPIPLPDLGDGPHLSYAIQWFAFAGIGIAGAIILFFRTPSKSADSPDSREA